MDNAAKDFAHKILLQLDKIVHLLSISPPRESNATSDGQQGETGEEFIQTVRHPGLTVPSPRNRANPKTAGDYKWPRWRIVEGIGITAAVIVAVANSCQWRDANRNFRVDQRPWIKVELIPSEPEGHQTDVTVATGSLLVIPIRVKNIGKTPANEVTGTFAIQIAGKDDDLFLPPDMNDPPYVAHPTHLIGFTHIETGTIFPDQAHDWPISKVGNTKVGKSEPVALTQSEVDLLAHGAALIYIGGTIAYFDEFGLKHWTRYCTTVPDSHNGQASCPKYNRADNAY